MALTGRVSKVNTFLSTLCLEGGWLCFTECYEVMGAAFQPDQIYGILQGNDLFLDVVSGQCGELC